MQQRVEEFQQALAYLDRVKASEIFAQSLQQSSPLQVVEQLIVPALINIGRQWQEGSLALSQIYMSGRISEEMVDQALPASDPDRKKQPRSAIVVLDDYHMLGKRIVYSVLRASGYELFDYGRMTPQDLVERVLAEKIRVLMISVLMLPSALRIREVSDALAQAGSDIRIIVGGAPFLFDKNLWQEVGADAMGENASDALKIIQGWMGELS
ncbi:MAG: cobalamin-dependent protein [Candidatus Thiodiazotropha sp. (ex. Lucinisca nassula)]|nr:cobalamin-dependent protein [Candidatus Thiodiazotropha sp. (ex. Lucinisca nassula)]